MGIFSRNPNEADYPGGKKHWTDVLKNEADGSLLFWRSPAEDFNTRSVLIVNPGEQAVFVNNGEIVQCFSGGRHELTTENYPFISRIRNAFSGGISSFHCIVYFFRSADTAELRWGTVSPIDVRDKAWGILTTARAFGVYKFRIVNPAQLLQKLIGNNITLHSQDELYQYFDSEFQTKIKSVLSQFLNSLDTELIGLNAHLETLSGKIQPEIQELVSPYGLECVNFAVSSLKIDMSKYEQIDAANLNQIQTRINAQAEAQRETIEAGGHMNAMQILGNRWEAQKNMDLLNKLADNNAVSSFSAVNAGLGFGAAAGSMFGSIAGQTMQQTYSAPETWDCTCGNRSISGNFCNQCGQRKPAAPETWDCTCGNRNITGNFCNLCGQRKPAAPETWDCTCGNRSISGNFCNLCGRRKGE